MKMRLHQIANARSGDKGNRLNIALVSAIPRTMTQSLPRSRRSLSLRHSPPVSPRASCVMICPNSTPSTTCSMTCWKAASIRVWASMDTARRCRSCCSTSKLRSQSKNHVRSVSWRQNPIKGGMGHETHFAKAHNVRRKYGLRACRRTLAGLPVTKSQIRCAICRRQRN